MPRLINLTHLDPEWMKEKLVNHCSVSALAKFVSAPWTAVYGDDTEMDTFDLEGMPPFLPIERAGMYATVLCKFANVAPHRDTHDDEYYILYVLSGQARLHVGSRQTESMDLSAGMCVLFNCDALHWAEGDRDNPVQVIIGGVTRAQGRAILYSKRPHAVFQSMMAETESANEESKVRRCANQC